MRRCGGGACRRRLGRWVRGGLDDDGAREVGGGGWEREWGRVL